MEFEVETEPVSKNRSKPEAKFRTAVLEGKTYYVNSKVKAKHMVQVESIYGTKLGDIEKGLRVLATLLYEAMGTEALSYEEMLEFELEALEPILSLVS
jgi:hypothetical protein